MRSRKVFPILHGAPGHESVAAIVARRCCSGVHRCCWEKETDVDERETKTRFLKTPCWTTKRLPSDPAAQMGVVPQRRETQCCDFHSHSPCNRCLRHQQLSLHEFESDRRFLKSVGSSLHRPCTPYTPSMSTTAVVGARACLLSAAVRP